MIDTGKLALYDDMITNTKLYFCIKENIMMMNCAYCVFNMHHNFDRLKTKRKIFNDAFRAINLCCMHLHYVCTSLVYT